MSRKTQGDEAEKIAWAFEKSRVGTKHQFFLRFVANRRGLGFDIQSLNSPTDTAPRFIEVKSISEDGHIFLTERERINLKALGEFAWLYLVSVPLRKVIKTIQNPIGFISSTPISLVYKIKI